MASFKAVGVGVPTMAVIVCTAVSMLRGNSKPSSIFCKGKHRSLRSYIFVGLVTILKSGTGNIYWNRSLKPQPFYRSLPTSLPFMASLSSSPPASSTDSCTKSSTQMNPAAQAFIPRKTWSEGDDNQESPHQPLIVYSNRADYVRADIQTESDVDVIGPVAPSNISTTTEATTYAGKLELAALEVQRSPKRLERLGLKPTIRGRKVDNSRRAEEARYHFDDLFGHDVGNLRSWQDICYTCGVSELDMPTSITKCKSLLRKVHVNIFDLVDASVLQVIVLQRFDNARELKIYSKQSGKICPLAAARGNRLFRFMFRKLF